MERSWYCLRRPLGFAIFGFKEDHLKEPNIWQIFGEHFRPKGSVWLKEFQICKDKSSAIDNATGVSRELTEMISRHHHPCQKLAVGKPEYKTIIEKSLPNVPCLFDETVMEVMWGLKNLMHSLVPQENLKLTKEDRLPMSQGLKKFLHHYGFDVKPELVNEKVVIAACLLHDAGLIVESHSKQLRWAAGKLKDVSGINSEGWDAMKTATALRIMFDLEDTTDDDEEFFTEEELSTLEMTAHKYEDIIDEDISLKFYSDLVEMREVKNDALEVLAFWLGSIPHTDPSSANYVETILVLFETPSGFAIFCFKEDYLNQPNIWAIFGEHFRPKGIVWLKEFQIFKDKSSAIDNATGVSRELTEMILRYHLPCQKLAVGKPEYKTIIETSLPGVPCLFDETVMEVMWGLKNLMHSLVPQEKLKLTKEDRLPMSQGLKMFLYHYGFDVKPELVNREVLVAACLLRDSGLIVESHSKKLRWAAGKLKDVSGINSEGWDAMKIATALRIMFDPAETTDHDVEIFTEEELSTLEMTAHKYEDIINKDVSLKFYSDLVEMREVKKDALKVLALWLGSSV